MPQWQQIVVFVSIASMALGSFAAIGQTNIKRLMAYSSIGHMGFALVGLAAGTVGGRAGRAGLYRDLCGDDARHLRGDPVDEAQRPARSRQISDFAGLSRTNPLLAFFFAMLLFSLAGVPPLAGFFAKFYVFVAAIKAGLFTLAVIGVLASVVGAYYYLAIVKVMYFDEPAGAARSDADRAAHACWRSRACSTSCSSSIRRRWSARRRSRRSRCSRWRSRSVRRRKRRATGSLAFDRLGSTNAEAMARARAGERGPIWFVTTEQTAGRGRRHRAWIAPRGNLAASVLEVHRCRARRSPRRSALPPGWRWSGAAEVSIERRLRPARIGSIELSAEMAERRAGRRAEARRHPAGGREHRRRPARRRGRHRHQCRRARPRARRTPATSLRALGVDVSAEELFAALSDAWAEFRGIWDNGRGFAEIRAALAASARRGWASRSRSSPAQP